MVEILLLLSYLCGSFKLEEKPTRGFPEAILPSWEEVGEREWRKKRKVIVLLSFSPGSRES